RFDFEPIAANDARDVAHSPLTESHELSSARRARKVGAAGVLPPRLTVRQEIQVLQDVAQNRSLRTLFLFTLSAPKSLLDFAIAHAPLFSCDAACRPN